MNNQGITDNSDLKKYRIELPNIIDDDMDPFQARLYMHYKRVCGAGNGECWEAVRTSATKCKMSPDKVTATRQWLTDNGWIQSEQDDKGIYHITIVDRWPENFVRYSGQAIRNIAQPIRDIVQPIRDIVREPSEISYQRKNPIKKEPIKKEPIEEGATPAPLTDQQEWFKVVCAIVAWDSKVLGAKEKAQVAQTIGILKNAGYTLEEAKSFLEKVWMKDWRYKKDGQMPTLTQLRTEIGKLRTAAPIIAKETSAYASFG